MATAPFFGERAARPSGVAFIRSASSAETRRERVPQYPELEDRLRNALGTKVSIQRGAKGGSIELHFFSDQELDRLVDILSNYSPQSRLIGS